MSTDLRPKWLNVTRSLQKAACRNEGVAVVSARVVVDSGGDPITWTEPDVVRLGPLSSHDDLIKLLAAHKEHAAEQKFLLAQILSGTELVINKGSADGVVNSDWFAYIDNHNPYAILVVKELRERITILKTVWISEHKNIVKIGNEISRLSW